MLICMGMGIVGYMYFKTHPETFKSMKKTLCSMKKDMNKMIDEECCCDSCE